MNLKKNQLKCTFTFQSILLHFSWHINFVNDVVRCEYVNKSVSIHFCLHIVIPLCIDCIFSDLIWSRTDVTQHHQHSEKISIACFRYLIMFLLQFEVYLLVTFPGENLNFLLCCFKGNVNLWIYFLFDIFAITFFCIVYVWLFYVVVKNNNIISILLLYK